MINLEHVKMLVTAEEVLIPVAGSENPESDPFVQDLTRRLTSSGEDLPPRVRSEMALGKLAEDTASDSGSAPPSAPGALRKSAGKTTSHTDVASLSSLAAFPAFPAAAAGGPGGGLNGTGAAAGGTGGAGGHAGGHQHAGGHHGQSDVDSAYDDQRMTALSDRDLPFEFRVLEARAERQEFLQTPSVGYSTTTTTRTPYYHHALLPFTMTVHCMSPVCAWW